MRRGFLAGLALLALPLGAAAAPADPSSTEAKDAREAKEAKEATIPASERVPGSPPEPELAPPRAVPLPVPVPPPGAAPRAVHVAKGPAIDGVLDDAAWAAAPLFDAFVLNEPTEGGPASERTEMRVVYDEHNLYIGFRCFDSRPGEINRSLGRRDSEPSSDFVVVFISPANDRRSARRFVVNAGGVLADTIYYDDTQSNQSWDAVWTARTTIDAGGWNAEMAIPLYLVGTFDGARPSWGFLARRFIARTHEKSGTNLIPRSSGGFVSRFGPLTGVEAIAPRRALEILPYVAIRSMIRPENADPAVSSPREALVAGDLGVDVALFLRHGLALNATLNPDFGQVEADDIILNLSTFETFFPEKRPFFTHGLDLFQPVGGDDFSTSQNLFYSRRIGRNAPILAAAKMTGSPLSGLSLGLLDAVVTPDRLLHAESAGEGGGRGVTTNYLAAVTRVALGSDSWIGGRFSAASPLAGECTADDAAMSEPPERCRLAGGNSAALDATVKTPDGDWAAFGQLAVSQAIGGPPSRLLLDGTLLERGDLGVGGYLRAGKVGGEPLLFQLGYDGESPALDLNAVGFQRDQNRHHFTAQATFFRPNGLGPLHSVEASLIGNLATSSDGRGLVRQREVGLVADAVLPGFHSLHAELWKNFGYDDLRELRGSGVAMDVSGGLFGIVTLTSDASRAVSVSGTAGAGSHDAIGPTPRRIGWTFSGGVVARPSPAWETRLDAWTDFTPYDPRFIERTDDDRFLLGRLDNLSLRLTLRQQWAVTRDLTLQAWAQLFSAYAVYGPFFEGRGTPDAPLRQATLSPAAAPMTVPDVHTTQLVVNVILRWEFRPGATLYIVYSRDQSERPPAEVKATLGSSGLWSGPATDVLSVKWTWFWSG